MISPIAPPAASAAQDTLSAAKAAIAELEGSTEQLQSKAAVGQELNSATNRVLLELTEQAEALSLEKGRLEAELAVRQAEVDALAAASAAVASGELSAQEEANEEVFRTQEQLAALRAELSFARAAREGRAARGRRHRARRAGERGRGAGRAGGRHGLGALEGGRELDQAMQRLVRLGLQHAILSVQPRQNKLRIMGGGGGWGETESMDCLLFQPPTPHCPLLLITSTGRR